MKLKRILTSLCFIVPLLLVIIYFSVGSTSFNNTITTAEKKYQVYLLAFEEGGYTGTYDQWLSEISGEIEIRVTDTEIQWKYKKDEDDKWQKLYELEALKGETGDTGADGATGETGATGDTGATGKDGLSAYDVWLSFNPDKTEEEFFDSLNVFNLWLKQSGNENKTIDDFLNELKGEDGEDGSVRTDVLYDIYTAYGYKGSFEEFNAAYEADELGSLKQQYYIQYYNGNTLVEMPEIYEVTMGFDGDRISAPNYIPDAQDGYEFTGWYYNDKEWLFDFYVLKEDIALEARFSAIEYTVTIDLGENANYYPGDIKLTVEDTISLPIPLKPGFTFDYWVVKGTNGDYGNTLTGILEDMTLEAVWKEDTVETHDVSYIVDGGVYETIEVENGGKLSKPADPSSTQTGYVFEGWYVDGEKWSFVGYTVTTDIELVAYFTEIKYPITYENVYDNENSYANKSYFTINDTVTLYPASSRDGYTFVEWRVNDSNGAAITSFTGSDYASDIVLYAVWEIQSYSVFYYFDQSYVVSSFRLGSDNTLPLTFDEKPHYTAIKYNNKLTNNDEVHELSHELLIGDAIHLDVTLELNVYEDEVNNINYVMFGSNDGVTSRWDIHGEDDGVYTLVSGYVVNTCTTYETTHFLSGDFLNSFDDSEISKITVEPSIFTIEQYTNYKSYYDVVRDNSPTFISINGKNSIINSMGNTSELTAEPCHLIVTMQITK